MAADVLTGLMLAHLLLGKGTQALARATADGFRLTLNPENRQFLRCQRAFVPRKQLRTAV